MFAFFYVTTVAACKVISGAKNLIINVSARNIAKKENRIGYWDTNGAYKDPRTNEQIYFSELKNRDRIISNLNGDIICNVDEDSRKNDIVQKNIHLCNEGSPVVLIGRFEDVCPMKINKGIWKHIPKRTAVYVDKKGKMYFRQPANSTLSIKNIYIDIENGMYVFLEDASQKDIEWLNKNNEGWVEGRRSFITLDPLVDRVI